MKRDIKIITVIGAGTMGHGIAHVFSRFGYQVNLYEPFDQVRETAMDKIKHELSFMAEEEYITVDEMERAMAGISLLFDNFRSGYYAMGEKAGQAWSNGKKLM